MGKTLVEKIWSEHLVAERADGRDLLYVDRIVMDEVRAPDAVRLLEASGREMRRPDLTFATIDHTIATHPGRARQMTPKIEEIAEALRAAAQQHAFTFFDVDSHAQGISHVVAPELGLVLPGATHVCSDSHASTVGALGALAFGCGATDLAHVLATQVFAIAKPMSMRIVLEGTLQAGVDAKDVALFVTGAIGTHGARGHVIEFTGAVTRALSMEGRFTLCNMAIEMGARSALIAPDETTFAWLDTCPWHLGDVALAQARAHWATLYSDADAQFDRHAAFDCDSIEPQISWGTDASMVMPISGTVPDPATAGAAQRDAHERALTYMGLKPGDRLIDRPLERVFIGSCTNARLGDLQLAAEQIRGGHVAHGVRAIVVPGSSAVKRRAEALGLDIAFRLAGFEWHESGCSMCSAGSADSGLPGERCASTSNRNFEDRQGRGVRTHLVSPPMAAAAALAGRFTDIRRSASA